MRLIFLLSLALLISGCQGAIEKHGWDDVKTTQPFPSDLNINSYKVVNMAAPTSDRDATTKAYVDEHGVPDYDDDSTHFLDGTGNWSQPVYNVTGGPWALSDNLTSEYYIQSLGPQDTADIFLYTVPWIGSQVTIAQRGDGWPLSVGTNNTTVINAAIDTSGIVNIVLKSDLAIGSTISMDQQIKTLDLNQHTITAAGCSAINVSANYCTVRNGRIVGDRTGGTKALIVYHAWGGEYDHLLIYNFDYGVYANGNGAIHWFEHILCSGIITASYYFAGAGNDAYVIDCANTESSEYAAVTYGIAIYDYDAVQIHGGDYLNCSTALYIAPAAGTNFGHHMISDTYLDSSGFACRIRGPGTMNSAYFNNAYFSASEYGFVIDDTNTVTKVMLDGCHVSNIVNHGIYVNNVNASIDIVGGDIGTCDTGNSGKDDINIAAATRVLIRDMTFSATSGDHHVFVSNGIPGLCFGCYFETLAANSFGDGIDATHKFGPGA